MIEHALLSSLGVPHGFGERDDPVPAGVLRPRQVHGAVVVRGSECATSTPPEADAVLGVVGDGPVAVVTADCVPVLLASDDGAVVAAVHAGWRGLAAGVVEAGVAALAAFVPGRSLFAVVGPHIGPCCYEVDQPVIEALGGRYPRQIGSAIIETRGEHADLDLGALTRSVLRESGLAPFRIGEVERPCTRCDALRFHSYRRDGPRAGRLLHHIRSNPEETWG